MENAIEKLTQAADDVVKELTAPINRIVDIIIASTDVSLGGSRNKLSMDDLYAIAIRLPAECAYLQSQINKKLIEQKIRSFLTEVEVTHKIIELRNEGIKGDAKERQRRAEALSQEEILQDAITKEIAAALQATIQRADKVYEGVKKIIDAKSREAVFDSKPGRSIA